MICTVLIPAEFDPDMAEAIVQNSRRYLNLFSEAVYEMLPDYKQREVFVTIGLGCLLIWCVYVYLLKMY